MALLWVLVFLLGGIAGAAGYRFYRNQKPKSMSHIRAEKRDFIIRELTRDLKLDAQQTESLKAIFDESIKQYRALSQQFQPQFRSIRNEADEKIKGILRPDQILLFEEKLKKYRKPESSEPPPPSSAPSSPPK